MLTVGNQHRTQHPTDANAESSRSHAVFQVNHCSVVDIVRVLGLSEPHREKTRFLPTLKQRCLKGMSRTITMQSFRLAPITDVEKTKLRRKC